MTRSRPRRLRYLVEAPPEPGSVTEVATDLYWLRLPLPMRLDHVNAYILDDGDGLTVVDTGFDTRKTRAIWAEALAGPLGGKPVRRVLVTHQHPDHVGLAGWFIAEHGAELLMTRTAWLMARMLRLDIQERAPAEALAFWWAAGMREDLYEARKLDRPYNTADVVAPLPLGFTRLCDGDTLSAGGREWCVRIGQGHAPDHATLWSEDGELVLGGDQLLPSISPNLGVYPTEPEADPVAEWMTSCRGFLPHATENQLVLPGHKLPFRGLPSRLDQLIENHEGALDRLMRHLREARTAADCFQPLFLREIGDGEYGLALVEAVAHCNHLYRTGKAKRWRDDRGRWLFRAA